MCLTYFIIKKEQLQISTHSVLCRNKKEGGKACMSMSESKLMRHIEEA